MVDTLKLAKDIYGGSGSNTENSSTSRSQKSTVTRTYGVCTSNSVNGEVEVDINGTKSTLPCTISIEASEENPRSVIIMVSNNQGIVTGYAGWGDGIQAGVDTAQDTADAAQDTADAAKDAASSAQTAADDARKVATNYIRIDDNEGITVGNMAEETLGKNTYIDANGVQIRDGETALASFSADRLILGMKPQNIKETKYVQLLGNSCIISATQTGEDTFVSNITSPYLILDANSACTIKMGDGSTAITGNYITLGSNPNTLALDGATQQWKVKGGNIYGETVLFNNPDQAMSGEITLSQDCTDFTYLDVYCKDNDGAYVHQRVYNPAVDRTFTVMSMASNANSFYIKYKRFAIVNTTTINTVQNSDGSFTCGEYDGSFTRSDFLNIIRVVGVA